jgi:hypothetical protein
MATTLTIVGLGGSVAEISRSRAALHVALEGAASAGAETELLDLHELELPMYNPDNDEPTPSAARLINGFRLSEPACGAVQFANGCHRLRPLGSIKAPYCVVCCGYGGRGDRLHVRGGRDCESSSRRSTAKARGDPVTSL